MANLHLVTGYAGREHVTAADVSVLNSVLLGTDQYVLGRGSQLAISVISNNQVRIADGDIIIQGRHVRLNENTYVDLTIENGTQGYMRNDLIVARYTLDESTAVEEVNLVVIKGENAASDPVDPVYTTGNIIENHATLHDMPLYRVPLDGLTIGDPVCLFDVVDLPEDGLVRNAHNVKQNQHTTATATLLADGWSNNTQTVSAEGVTANNTVLVAPAPAYQYAYGVGGIKCIAQTSGKLTFECTKTPDANITVNIIVLGV